MMRVTKGLLLLKSLGMISMVLLLYILLLLGQLLRQGRIKGRVPIWPKL
jgi:hypothetical protein